MKQFITIQDISDHIADKIDKKCHEYAQLRMKSEDWILVSDSYDSIPDEGIITKNINNRIFTIKRSKKDVYEKYYFKLFSKVVS